MSDSTLVRVGVTGGIYAALTGTATVPTDATSTLTGFDELGYVSDAGVTQTINSNTSDIIAWQNGDLVRRIQTSHDVTYGLTFLETSPEVLEAYYGNYTAGHVEITGEILPRIPWVIDVFDDNQKIRLVIPSGQITERGDVSLVNGEAISYPVTITAYPVAGAKAHLYLADLDDEE